MITHYRLLILSVLILIGGKSSAQIAFTNSNAKIGGSGFHSGCAVTVVDANFDGLDDILRMEQGHDLYFELQHRDGSFTSTFLGTLASSSSWAMTCADVDHNGWRDLVMDVDGGIALVKLFNSGGNVTTTTTLLTNSSFFLQNATFCDANNDGWIDLFCCDDNAAAHIYMNDGAGNLQISTYINFALNPGINYGGDPADSGNYGSAWIDFDNDGDLDLYVAHCRQSSTSPTDLRRINRLFVNDGTNHFTEDATSYGIDIGWQTWTSSFGDLDNDGDLDLVLTNHDHVSQIFVNDGTGHYTENTTTGFHTNSITPIESIVEDFDNDGYADIMVAGSDFMMWKNNGNMTFTQVTTAFDTHGMLSFATGDLNHDGFVDLYASYGQIYTTPTSNPDILYLNNGTSNHFISFNLKGTNSDINAIGGRVSIYGPWGTQIREVRAGESYGTCNSSQLHFGLGNHLQVDSAVVWFTNGTTQRFYNLHADQFVTVEEGVCSISNNYISGSGIICSGQTATLNATSGYSAYDWSSGQTGSSITVSTGGVYSVTVSDGSCINTSPAFTLQVSPDETPTVATAGELTFCHGGSVTLTSSPAISYQWSDGSTANSLTVTESGSYTVTIQGYCGMFTSAPVNVDVLAAPTASVSNVSIVGPASTTLSATGNNISWYDQQTGGTLLGTGPSFTTPVLSTNTTYWVQNTTSYPGLTDYTGMTYHNGTLYSGATTNGTVDFTVLAPCVLKTVKVYTDSVGTREIQLLDNLGNVVNSTSANIPLDTSRVTLNYTLAPGSYQLTTNANVNMANFNTQTPRLQRSSLGVAYPYVINNLISLNSSNQGANYYYYFYDWEVQQVSTDCESERVPLLVEIITGINDLTASGISIYPNPATSQISINSNSEAVANIFDASSRLVKTVMVQSGINTVDVSTFAPGIYHVEMVKAGAKANYKLVISK
ncbi:MAG: FG-GAP-like repeat-containing protein [Bacteroidia bacterium]